MSRLFICIFTVCFCSACATPSQMYWDHKVKELCEKDGGVTVYERVALSKEEFEKLDIRFENNLKKADKYYRASIKDEIINDSPKVWRGGQSIVRISDNKVLGRQIYYGRVGGDVPTGISHPSHFGCENIEGFNLGLQNSIFYIEDK